MLLQSASVLTNIPGAIALEIGQYFVTTRNRKDLEEARGPVRRKACPQVVFYEDYNCLPELALVVRNVSGGAAQNVTSEFSRPVAGPDGHVISDVPFYEKGPCSPAPGALVTTHRSPLEESTRVTTRYKDIADRKYGNTWTLNPALFEGNRDADRKSPDGLGDAVQAPDKEPSAEQAEVGYNQAAESKDHQPEDGEPGTETEGRKRKNRTRKDKRENTTPRNGQGSGLED